MVVFIILIFLLSGVRTNHIFDLPTPMMQPIEGCYWLITALKGWYSHSQKSYMVLWKYYWRFIANITQFGDGITTLYDTSGDEVTDADTT